MDRLQADIQQYALFLVIYSVQACASLIMSTLPLPGNTPESLDQPDLAPSSKSKTTKQNWSEEEVTDLVDYLYQHRSEGTGGNFKAQTFTSLSHHLAEKHPSRIRTREAIQAKFRSVRFYYIITSLDL